MGRSAELKFGICWRVHHCGITHFVD